MMSSFWNLYRRVTISIGLSKFLTMWRRLLSFMHAILPVRLTDCNESKFYTILLNISRLFYRPSSFPNAIAPNTPDRFPKAGGTIYKLIRSEIAFEDKY